MSLTKRQANYEYVRVLHAYEEEEQMPSYNDVKKEVKVMNLDGDLLRLDYYNKLTGHLLATIFFDKSERFKHVKWTRYYYTDLHIDRLRNEISEKVIELLNLKNSKYDDLF